MKNEQKNSVFFMGWIIGKVSVTFSQLYTKQCNRSNHFISFSFSLAIVLEWLREYRYSIL